MFSKDTFLKDTFSKDTFSKDTLSSTWWEANTLSSKGSRCKLLLQVVIKDNHRHLTLQMLHLQVVFSSTWLMEVPLVSPWIGWGPLRLRSDRCIHSLGTPRDRLGI